MTENLTPWKPGQSGNPGGRPKKSPVTDYVKSQLEKPIPDAMKEKLPDGFLGIYGSDATFGQLLAFQLIASSAKGDISAVKELLDRVEGKVTQKIAGEDGGPIQFTLTRAGKEQK